MHPTADAWFARRTSCWQDWPAGELLKAKSSTTVSVVLPALDEEPTIEKIISGVRELVTLGLVDEIAVVDSGSVDGTASVAAAAGATVYHRDDILPRYGSRPGKGEVLWKSLAVTSGDVIVFVDSDLVDFRPHFITGLLGPLLTDPSVALVKAFYDRPLLDVSPAGGGRVTELMARPLLNAYFPELAGVIQPLAGEYAARRPVLASLPFAAGYGVETGLLIDAVHAFGLDALAQVDLGERTHGHQHTTALGAMAATILRVVAERIFPDSTPWPDLTQFRRLQGTITAVDTEIALPARPPMTTIPEYAESRAYPSARR